MNYFRNLVTQSIQRSRESTMGLLGIRHDGLRDHVRKLLADDLGGEGEGLLASPVFEHTFGWQQTSTQLAQLEGNLLSSDLIDALSTDGAHQFARDAAPYSHQLLAWKTLLGDQPRSVVITSGTGSGKTECFMVPILEDLVRDRAQNGKLQGVRALFLYPLNALINSQRERLDAWTRAFGDDIRFCLYNGNTEERADRVRKEQAERPNEILSRELLRREPSPILMTNATMLEYMMIRQIDSPIIETSKQTGSLRWIVLDEAHTYVGSQAAELSLLLRRVVQAFGKRPEQIRFVATSATIADGDASTKLSKYLASLAGVPESHVVVIGGQRAVPTLTPAKIQTNTSLQDITSIDPTSEFSTQRYDALASHGVSFSIRKFLVELGRPARLDEIVAHVAGMLTTKSEVERKFEVLAWIDAMTGTANGPNGDHFLKVRGHFFQRVLQGLWCCADHHCGAKPDALVSWPFGKVYATQRGRCECGAPVCELAFCNACKAPHLLAEDAGGVLRQVTPDASDEFSLIEDVIADPDDNHENGLLNADRTRGALCLAPAGEGIGRYVTQQVSRIDHRIGADTNATFPVSLVPRAEATCWECEAQGQKDSEFLRGAYLGAPFYLTGIVPTVLEFCPDPSRAELSGRSPEELPGRGRRVITFTDSRQGTARMAVRMQQEAERSRLRGLVFEIVRNAQAKSDASLANATTTPEQLEGIALQLRSAGLLDEATKLEQQARALRSGGGKKPRTAVSWRTLVNALAETSDLHSITEYNRHVNPTLFTGNGGKLVMAELLLAREFFRRPKNQNSTETLGLIQVGYNRLSEIEVAPSGWIGRMASAANGGQRALDIEDWRHFLKVALDFHVRENSFIAFLPAMREWMGNRFAPKRLMPPNSDAVESSTIKKWPHVRPGHATRLVKILEAATGLDRSKRDQADLIDTWLRSAWQALVNALILEPKEGSYALDKEALTFSLPSQAWLCPVTRRLIDTTLRGVTPYLPPRFHVDDYRCSLIELADFVRFSPSGDSKSMTTVIRKLVDADPIVSTLRRDGLWTDLSDRTTEGGFYYRTAEHSAQQSSKRLKAYEDMFKAGYINALNCSTTMEMGVDIGGVSAVVMNNVPPHPANYLQRAGRAGRRRESRSIAYTLCKANPREMRVFRDSLWPFVTRIAAPTVTLSSDRIVARHVHSMLLAQFLIGMNTDGDRTRLTLSWFFGGDTERVDEKFIAFLAEPPKVIPLKIRELTKGTVLADRSVSSICDAAAERIRRIGDVWRSEKAKIDALIAETNQGPYRRALERELARLEKEYLLRDLCSRAFLPGYGFPTDVVTINTSNRIDFQTQKETDDRSREDNRFIARELPSRSLDIAIREYAPGSQVVIDGRVFRSAGLSLQWHSGGSINEAQRFDVSWRCRKCGCTGLREHAYANESEVTCSECGASGKNLEKDKVIRPAGFLTDFFAELSNDISSQKFIPTQEPRVSVRGEAVALPDARCGHLVFGHDGHVFHHSRGEHENGYAVCMVCGRAESMSATNEPPYAFRPGSTHWPLRGGRREEEAKCSAESVMRNVHLGYQFLTDVLEIYLKSPVSSEWIGTDEKSKIAASTFALALRESLASRIGISSSEIDFAIRQDKVRDTGRARTVIQLFDRVSGGAGFVLAGVTEIASLIKEARSRLDCHAECETVCSTCLTGSDSEVERRRLDRHLAIEWFDGTGIGEHLSLPARFSAIPGARYCSLDPRRFVASRVNEGARSLTFLLHGTPAEWDLTHAEFRSRLLRWRIIDGLKVTLLLPEGVDLPEETRRALAGLSEAGIDVCSFAPESGDVVPLLQTFGEGGCHTLYSDRAALAMPGDSWLAGIPDALLVMTSAADPVVGRLIDTAAWTKVPPGTVKLRITHEMDGAVTDFGKRFLLLLNKEAPQAFEQLKANDLESVRYSDRYLATPWALVLLGEVLRSVTRSSPVPLRVQALRAGPTDRSRGRVTDNWTIPEAQKKTMEDWLQKIGFSEVRVDLAPSRREMPHFRQMVLHYRSGNEVVIDFDQGMGYWSARLDRPFDTFSEDASLSSRHTELQRALTKARVVGVGPAYTPVYVEIRKKS